MNFYNGVSYSTKISLSKIIIEAIKITGNDVPTTIVINNMRNFIIFINDHFKAQPEMRTNRSPRYVTRQNVDVYFAEVIKIECAGQTTNSISRHASSLQKMFDLFKFDQELDYNCVSDNANTFTVRHYFVNNILRKLLIQKKGELLF